MKLCLPTSSWPSGENKITGYMIFSIFDVAIWWSQRLDDLCLDMPYWLAKGSMTYLNTILGLGFRAPRTNDSHWNTIHLGCNVITFNNILCSCSQFVVDPCMEFNVVKYPASFIFGTLKPIFSRRQWRRVSFKAPYFLVILLMLPACMLIT